MAGRSLSWLLAAILLVSLCFTPYTTASPVDIGKLEKRDDGNNQHVKRQSVTLARARGSALASMMSTVTPSSTLAPVRPTTSTLAPVRPTTTSRSASTSSSSSAATPSNTNYAFASNILRAHNSARASHGAAALTWSSGAESLAKTWAERCVWEHGGNPGLGQNLASSAGYRQTGQQTVDAWMSEESDYDPANPVHSHFTQIVWKATRQIGCYQAACTSLRNSEGGEVFPGFSPVYYTVCNYNPPGNVYGQFDENVEKNE